MLCSASQPEQVNGVNQSVRDSTQSNLNVSDDLKGQGQVLQHGDLLKFQTRDLLTAGS